VIEPAASGYCWAADSQPPVCVDPPPGAITPLKRHQVQASRNARVVIRLTTPAERLTVVDVDSGDASAVAGESRRWTFRAHGKPGLRTMRAEATYAPGTRAYYFRIKVVKRPKA
jgi:hypothetical protein